MRSLLSRRGAVMLSALALVGGAAALVAPSALAASTSSPSLTLNFLRQARNGAVTQLTPVATDWAAKGTEGGVAGQVTAALAVPSGNQVSPTVVSLGCDAANFVGFPVGAIAVIDRGTCTFWQKMTNAENAGASAVIFINSNSPLFSPNLGAFEPVPQIPGVMVPNAARSSLQQGTATVTVSGWNADYTYTVNRGSKQIARISCAVDGQALPASSCGTIDPALTTKSSSTYDVNVSASTTASHVFSVTVTLTDRGSVTNSAQFGS